MFERTLSLAGFAVAATLGLSAPASAATLGVYTTLYGTNDGHVAPLYGGAGNLGADYVTVEDRKDDAGNRFFDAIDFSDLVGSAIDSLTLTLDFSGANDPVKVWGIVISREHWDLYLTTNGGTDQYTDRVVGGTLSGNSLSLTLDQGDVFDQAVSSGVFAFWFGEETAFSHDFKLYSASLTVAAVPVPAAGLLLLGGLGGLAAVRRRKAAAAV